ncbi:MAG TPA: M13 family metallopeptidase, partial [Verrucomicrobiae bacterium]|nr:M13 family metallopeptidase [Verrucomicrobiae bacterium]
MREIIGRSLLALAVAAAILCGATALRADTETQPGSGKTPGFDPSAIDKKTDPCTDFYQYACGGWIAANPPRADEPRWGRFNELQERNEYLLREILEKDSVGEQAERNPVDRMVGDYYSACMDEKTIEAKGSAPLKDEMSRIAAVNSKDSLAVEVAHLHAVGVNVFFRFRSQQDFKDATSQIAAVDQGGLGLFDRDQYLKDDPKSVEIRKAYVAHVQKMFQLLGDKPDAAAAEAKTVMDLETSLAKASLERVKRRDPQNVYHKMSKGEMTALVPSFAWNSYFAGVPAPPVDSLNVAVPDFLKGLEPVLAATDMENLRTYMRWHLVTASAALLPSSFVDENFEFFGKVLTGAKEQRPRWKRCVEATDGDLGEALGQRYVEQNFGTQGKERMKSMVAALEKALETDINTLPWMTDVTKKQALNKLHAIANKIGYPDKWLDYSSIKITRDDALGNGTRANVFENKRQLTKIGQPIDRKEWQMSPPTVNAYYNPLMNDINFPAGILQPPFFDNKIDDAVNYGAIGAVIGHELTHGFDDQGRKFAANGDLADWWTDADAKEFETRASCVSDEYGSFTAVDDVKLNGKLTLGENTADNGGLRIAYMALMDTIAGKGSAPVDGFTPEQRFFLGWAQIWRAK